MLNIWTTMSMLAAIRVMDYYNDKDRLEREQLHDYAVCLDELDKNIKAMGRAINSVLEKSRRYDLEQEIARGERQLPPYIFMTIAGAQEKPISEYQRKGIDIYFDMMKDSGLSKSEYLAELESPGATGEELYAGVGLTVSHCGTFWDKFIELLYEADHAEAEFECMVKNYAESVWRFALLGDCDSRKAEEVFQVFSDGLQNQLETGAQMEKPDGEEKLKADAAVWLNKMRENCRAVSGKGTEEGQMVMDLFDYFIASLFIGLLENAADNEADRIFVLQYLIDAFSLQCEIGAEAIYQGCRTNSRVYQVFYESANSWEEASFWKVHQIASARAGIPELSAEFAELALEYLKAAEFLLRYKFPKLAVSGKAEVYMGNIIEKMTELASEAGEEDSSRTDIHTDTGEKESADLQPGAEAKDEKSAGEEGEKDRNASIYEEAFMHRIEQYGEQYGSEGKPAEKKKGFIAGIVMAAIVCGVLIFAIFH